VQRPVEGIRYRALDMDGNEVFRSESLVFPPADGEHSLTVLGSSHAAVTVSSRRLSRGTELSWTVTWTGPAVAWNRWQSGFELLLRHPVERARCRNVNRWVRPTGVAAWDVPGDTPYPDLEFQVREIHCGDTAVVVATPDYDPDWIYGGDHRRARSLHYALPPEPDADGRAELTARMSVFTLPVEEVQPHEIAARAAGRPVAVSLGTGVTGNLFEPDASVPLSLSVRNVTPDPAAVTLDLEVWSYGGRSVAGTSESFTLAPGAARQVRQPFTPGERGVFFAVARVGWEGGEGEWRTTVGALPQRREPLTTTPSPFGLAAVIADPDRYPDQVAFADVVPMLERIGVRWLRGGWCRLQSVRPAPAEVHGLRERMGLLREAGIQPHLQLVIEPGELDELTRLVFQLRNVLVGCGWITPYIAVGNELNLHGISAGDYVEKLLRPVVETMRQDAPDAKVVSMELGGVDRDWLEAFEAARGFELIDILAIHPGCQPRPPEVWEGYRGWVFRSQVQDALAAAARHGDLPVWITEAYAPTQPARNGVDLRTSADYLVRTYACSIALGIPVVEWYQFQDGTWYAARPRPDDWEYSYGIVYSDLTPKPAYVAYAAMTEELEGAAYIGRLDLGAEDLYGVRFRHRDGHHVDLLWSYREKHETDVPWWPPENVADVSRRPGEPWEERWQASVAVVLPAVGAAVEVRDVMGNVRQVEAADDRVSLGLTGSPVYVTGLGDVPLLPVFWDPIP
jgi:hypothetical protein